MYELKYSPAVIRYLKKLKNKQLKKRFQEALHKIQDDPYCGEAKTGDLRGLFGLDLYYDRINYEIAYMIEEEQLVIIVILVGTRENFYKELKKYLR